MDLETSELGWKHYNDSAIIDSTVKWNFGGMILEYFQFNIDVSKLIRVSKLTITAFTWSFDGL